MDNHCQRGMAPLGIGLALFDLKDNEDGKKEVAAKGGWMSIDGVRAQRFAKPQDLDADVLWIVNLSKTEFWGSGLVRLARLRHSGFLGPELWDLMKETGWIPKKEGTAESCEALSEMVARAVRLTSEWARISVFRESELCLDVKDALFGERDAEEEGMSLELEAAVDGAWREEIFCELGAKESGSRHITLKMPRWERAKALCKTMAFPMGPWEFKNANDFGSEGKAMEGLLAQGRPFIAKAAPVKWVGEQRDVWRALWPKNNPLGPRGRKGDKEWLGQADMDWLRNVCEFEIKGAFIGAGYKAAEKSELLPDFGALGGLSVSAGVAGQAMVDALGAKGSRPGKKTWPIGLPRGLWLQGGDRMFCAGAALVMAQSEFYPVKYGSGGVTVALRGAQGAEGLAYWAQKAGLALPLGLAAAGAGAGKERADEDDALVFAAKLDGALKRLLGKNSSVFCDRLMPSAKEARDKGVEKLKDALRALMDVKDQMPEGLKKRFTEALGQQARLSVDRIKRQRGA